VGPTPVTAALPWSEVGDELFEEYRVHERLSDLNGRVVTNAFAKARLGL
jgi:hypothetical protein